MIQIVDKGAAHSVEITRESAHTIKQIRNVQPLHISQVLFSLQAARITELLRNWISRMELVNEPLRVYGIALRLVGEQSANQWTDFVPQFLQILLAPPVLRELDPPALRTAKTLSVLVRRSPGREIHHRISEVIWLDWTFTSLFI
jgi:hypothetical protein